MDIKLVQIPIKDVFDGYIDDEQTGRVTGYGGKLNIRPAYQREFDYGKQQRDAVIDTIFRGFPATAFPLNVMYWAENEDGTYEMIDGQQRTISICQYANADFSVMMDGMSLGYPNLTSDQREWFDNYELMIYICKGTDKEKLDWFKIINIAGEELYEQELRNAIYTGPWLASAKRFFSKRGCKAENIAGDYLRGSAIRQDYLETVLQWISARENISITDYMAKHQHDADANELIDYFESVFEWVLKVFPNNSKARKKLMCGLEWGIYYNKYADLGLENKAADFEAEISRYLVSDDIETKNGGIYKYLLTGQSCFLNVRAFSPSDRQWAYERQHGHCPYCLEKGDDTVYQINEMDADHIKPWSKGGKTERDNCQLLCKLHNSIKSNR